MATRLSLSPSPPLLSGEEEARAFWRMRLRIVRTLVQQTFAEAWFRLALITLLSGLLWAGLFLLFVDGFDFLRKSIPSAEWHDQAVRAVFGMFFAALSVMLVFSAGIILYSSLFRGPDVGMLLTMPARAERVFLHKFQEAVVLSSWAFLLLGSPMMLAYGVVSGAPWYYFALLLPLLIAFTYIPAALGAILCLAIVRYLPRGRVLLLVAVAVAVLAAGGWLGWSVTQAARTDVITPTWFQDLLDRLTFTDIRLLPSWWLCSGLMEAGRAVWTESLLFLALLAANALFFRQVAVWTAARLYRAGYSRLHSERTSRKRTRLAWIDRLAARATSMLPAQVQLLVIKDFRLFRRDPVQWSQFLIFFGLLVLYFLNIRRFRYDNFYADWVSMVSLLNLSVVGLLLSTFTTRFIFPMISLEGRRFWVLGLLPVRRETILTAKFLFALCGSVLPCSGLILLSDAMLRVRPMIAVSHQLTCLILCFGLSGIAVGLGAKMPSLREQSPSRIAAGFGGTLNLVLSTAYIALLLVLMALPSHLYFGESTSQLAGWLSDRASLKAWLDVWLFGGTAAAVLVGAAATALPLWIGLKEFRRMQF